MSKLAAASKIAEGTGNSKPARGKKPVRTVFRILLIICALIVIGTLVWQGVTAQGNPNPTAPHTSPTAAVLDIAVLVFREGLESILVLAAIIASMTGEKQSHRKPIVAGAGVAFIATLITHGSLPSALSRVSATVFPR